jgi:hypothetical protein
LAFFKNTYQNRKVENPKKERIFSVLIGLSTAKIGKNVLKPSTFKGGRSLLQEIQESVGRSLKCAVVEPLGLGLAFFFEELACQAALSLTLSSPLK